ncbi:hypothetical protein DFR50_1295 [Roseiarcus fermentans]|uniref:Uncharacterized protein n=1 Tax=Roseiarcus fermentans TaxID=1473586 RepID=A0A366F038_9HYPH|nr:BrnT family toxin [Roseiarcus fermentans]RBP07075.1 hypothetical protein DFR50_1295 [Roseiarcus fermentans]
MTVTCDPAKRERTLQERGLDFLDAEMVFSGRTLTLIDDRKAYGEVRYQTYGFVGDRVVMVVWTDRAPARHVISMRYCHEREAAKVRARMG